MKYVEIEPKENSNAEAGVEMKCDAIVETHTDEAKNDYRLVTKLEEAYSNGEPKVMDRFIEFIPKGDYGVCDTNLACPICGEEYSVSALLRPSDGSLDGWDCDECCHETSTKEDLRHTIHTILYFTMVSTPRNAKIANLLFDLFTEQMEKYVCTGSDNNDIVEADAETECATMVDMQSENSEIDPLDEIDDSVFIDYHYRDHLLFIEYDTSR